MCLLSTSHPPSLTKKKKALGLEIPYCVAELMVDGFLPIASSEPRILRILLRWAPNHFSAIALIFQHIHESRGHYVHIPNMSIINNQIAPGWAITAIYILPFLLCRPTQTKPQRIVEIKYLRLYKTNKHFTQTFNWIGYMYSRLDLFTLSANKRAFETSTTQCADHV